jgi:glycosyltransferase involved in cell wall biosynthesis
LERLNIEVVLMNPWSREHDFQLVHIFGSNYEVASTVEVLSSLKIPIVVSTIAYSVKSALLRKMWQYIDHLIPVPTTYTLRQRIYDLADRLVVASNAEAYHLSRYFRIQRDKVRWVPLGIEAGKWENVQPDDFVTMYGLKDFVLQVGRINRHKGQCRLIRALEGTGLQLVFIGPFDPSDPDGVNEFKTLVSRHPWVHYLGELSYESPALPSAYAAARVHVLPSLSESLGLVTLEAVAAGTAAVSGRYPPICEYLGDRIYYCDPRSIVSIRKAVLDAYEAGPKAGAREYVLSNFSWDQAAERLLKVYKELI